MSINKTYIAKIPSIIEALNEIDNFTIKMSGFVKKNPDFEYKVNITKTEGNIYIIELNVKRNEPRYN